MYRPFAVVVLTVVLSLVALPASAQAPRPERPYRGLFGGGAGDADQSLTAGASVAAGYDDDLLAEAGLGSGVAPDERPQGVLTSMSGSLAYSLQTGRFTLAMSAGTSARYYPSSETREFVRGSQGSLSISVPLRDTTSFSAGASIAYQPYSVGALFPAGLESPINEAPVPDLDLALTTENYIGYHGNLALSHNLSRRTSVGVSYGYNATANSGAQGEFSHQNAGARLTHNIGRGLDLRVGYGYGDARYGDGNTTPTHAIDAGVDYNRSLSISRRTTVSFGTGSTAMRSRERVHYTVTGNARLNHEIGRSWSTFLSYGRRVLLHETWQDLVMSDSVGAGLGGLLTRRMQLSSGVSGALGTVGAERNAPGFDSVHANTTLGIALTRFMSMSVTYAYYHHRFDSEVQMPVGVANVVDRQSVRVALSLWAPLFQRVRSSDASR